MRNGDFVLDGFADVLPDKMQKTTAKDGYVQFFPHTDGIDGFFICRMKRKS